MIITLILAICALTTRPYWIVSPSTFAQNGSVHTHVQITGYVNYTACEDDGDLHIRIVPIKGATSPYFIAECIPSMPCVRPSIGSQITVRGISRRDPEHQWWEVHPVESLQ